MENITFSDDDEYEKVRDKMFEGSFEEPGVQELELFGMRGLVGKKQREDVFLRGLDVPTNSKDPYEDNGVKINSKFQIKKANLAQNFLFFGMAQLRSKIDAPTVYKEEMLAEREKILQQYEENIITNENVQNNRRKRKSMPEKVNKAKKRDEESDSEEDSDGDDAENVEERRRTLRRRSEPEQSSVKRSRRAIIIESSDSE
ncbi:unnamed protein product [Caenorhabditis bovis]|uniref:Uncharacterized protein n=1 Tax=Caenorhabditis bovis TaxID=2654633 RepID=A0A8S1F2J1_9PELO|nr:unnamed protein product [Caenorhabditis bovis]